MTVTAIQVDRAKQVTKALDAAHLAHPTSPALDALHNKLAALLESFETEMSTAEYQTLGGGTNKS